MDLNPIADALQANPAAAAAVAGAIVALLVQCWKKLFNLAPGDDKAEKVLVAIVAAVLVSWAEQHLAGGFDLGQFFSVAAAAWLTAAGVHGTFLRSGK